MSRSRAEINTLAGYVCAAGLLPLFLGCGSSGVYPVEGNVAWKDETHFTFKVMGSGTTDPGLSFTRSS